MADLMRGHTLTGQAAAMVTCPTCETVWPSLAALVSGHLMQTRDEKHYALCLVLFRAVQVSIGDDWFSNPVSILDVLKQALAHNDTREEPQC